MKITPWILSAIFLGLAVAGHAQTASSLSECAKEAHAKGLAGDSYKAYMHSCIDEKAKANAAAAAAEPPKKPLPAKAASAAKVDEAAIRAAMETHLKDASSAKFHSLQFDGITLCGLLNSKNSYGAYGGYVPFAVMYVADKPPSVTYITVGDLQTYNIFCPHHPPSDWQ